MVEPVLCAKHTTSGAKRIHLRAKQLSRMVRSPLQTAHAASDLFSRWKRDSHDQAGGIARESLFERLNNAFILRSMVRRFAAENNFSREERRKLARILNSGVCEVVYIADERRIANTPITARALFLVTTIDFYHVRGYPIRAVYNPQFSDRVDALHSFDYGRPALDVRKFQDLRTARIVSGSGEDSKAQVGRDSGAKHGCDRRSLDSDVRRRVFYVRTVMHGVANQYITRDLSLAGFFAHVFSQPCFGSVTPAKKPTDEITAPGVSA